jgi:hypothetical protein
VRPLSKFLLLLANGFVTFYYWSSYQHGLSVARTLLYLFFSLVAINLALFFGQRLAERRLSRKPSRRN